MLEHIGRYAALLFGGWVAGLIGALVVGTIVSIATAGELSVVGGAIGFFGGIVLTVVLGWKWAKSG
ncbi:MAG: hypothetical protein IIC91_04650 [Chloroflexi bacterium]|nr:hypothetical protein [Chloroflexota bacterium]